MTISESLSRIAQNLMPNDSWTQDDYDHLKNIITALEEKQERGKGCPRCDPKNIVLYYNANVPNYRKHCGRNLSEYKDQTEGKQ